MASQWGLMGGRRHAQVSFLFETLGGRLLGLVLILQLGGGRPPLDHPY